MTPLSVSSCLSVRAAAPLLANKAYQQNEEEENDENEIQDHGQDSRQAEM